MIPFILRTRQPFFSTIILKIFVDSFTSTQDIGFDSLNGETPGRKHYDIGKITLKRRII